MRIGIEAQRIFRTKKHGMDMVALETIKALQLIDTVNEYYIYVRKGEDVCLNETPNFKIITVPGLNYADWEQIWLPIYARKHKLDILHATSNTAPLWYNRPTSVIVHDVIYLESQSSSNTNWYQILGKYYRRIVVPIGVKRSQKVFTVSHFEKQCIDVKLKLHHDKVMVVYNACGAHFAQPKKQEAIDNIKLKYKLPSNYLFYIGNTDPKKNVHNTILAFRDYFAKNGDALPLVIADLNEESLLKVLKTLDCLSLRNNIVLTGYVHNADLPYIMAGCTVFLYPSLRESFGIPLIEAMACGVPVITSNTSALPEIAHDAAILVNPINYLEISKAINKAAHDYNLRSNLITKGYERAQMFSWENSAKRTLEYFKSI